MSSDSKRILIVDDNAAVTRVVQFSLEQVGFQVQCANNGRDAWSLLAHTTFDLVVTDFQMPEMDGHELCQRMRSEERYAQTPIMLVTAKQGELDLSRLKEELGNVVLVGKPFSPRELTRLAQELLGVCAAP